MTKVLEDAIEKVKALPADRQERAAELLEQLISGDAVYPLSDAERAAARAGLAELDRGECASDTAVCTLFDKYRL